MNDTSTEAATIQCSTCKKSKSESEFNWKVKDVKRSTVCKECHKKYRRKHYQQNKEKYIEKAIRWARENPDRGGYRQPKYLKYGLTEEEYNRLVSEAQGRCAICKKSVETLYVDHDHSCCATITGLASQRGCGACVRGLLCQSCNIGLGHFGDSTESLKSAIDYLNKNQMDVVQWKNESLQNSRQGIDTSHPC